MRKTLNDKIQLEKAYGKAPTHSIRGTKHDGNISREQYAMGKNDLITVLRHMLTDGYENITIEVIEYV